jgi:uncharacterized membrane protein YsdA (DUF1294 family)/cold shock CspA family protein
MRKEGTIVRWDEAKGFGFIRSGAVAQDVFVHVRDYRSHDGGAPRPGLRVTFEDIHVGGKGPRAVSVEPISASPGTVRRASAGRAQAARPRQKVRRGGAAAYSGAWWALPLMAAYALALSWLAWHQQLPWWMFPAWLLLNLATFFTYSRDKYAARNRGWRVKENTLHLWSLAGGWAGAWFAQQLLRHKSVKASFRGVYWATVVIHCGAAFGVWWFFDA